jgi:4-diphosphocytidyl-2-C-methyl-D-erythritol kinase
MSAEPMRIEPRLMLGLPAPAKLNLFLHVLGRRPDGYHDLQSAMQLIDLADSLDFELRPDGALDRSGDLVGTAEGDLCLRAARLLQATTGCRLGVQIRVRKRIPAGAGMGGGSSDAATTLIALNRLWRLGLDRATLARLGLQLGADVPFFVEGRNAFVEGLGEILSPLDLPARRYVVIWPGVPLATAAIFSDPGLTRDGPATKIAVFSAALGDSPRALFGSNALEPVARRHAAEVDDVLSWLGRFGQARMTGSGSAVFVAVESDDAARRATQGLPDAWRSWVVNSLDRHPLSPW